METLSAAKIQSWLAWFLKGILLLGFIILIGRLFDLQVIRGNYYRQLSEGNRIRRLPIKAGRGNIYARGGEQLVGNKTFDKYIIFDPQEGYKEGSDSQNFDFKIEETEREYFLGETMAHISGYLGEVDEAELGKTDPKCAHKGPRKLGDQIGKEGLEKEYDCMLRGINGEELIEVDAMGKTARVLGTKKPIQGEDLKISVDYGLQNYVSQLLDDVSGAIVVSDPNGEILAFYSSPSYDPNIFIDGKNEEISQVLTSSELPLFNRVTSGSYHPGSVVKPVVAIAALEEGAIDSSYRYTDTGAITIESVYGKFSYNNWYFTQYGSTEGEIDIKRAIARSTDTFFYKTGELLGINNLTDWYKKFGYEDKTGIDLPSEVEGLVPSPEWKLKTKGERWFLGNTYHVSIGQGDLAVTPLQINRAISAVSNHGKICKPHFYGDIICQDLNISKDNIDLVIEGMIDACQTGGTGFPFFDAKQKVACKTGTAEIAGSEDTHAWFTFFAPVVEDKDPQIVVTVLIEKGGEGSSVAGPVARKIYNYWFNEGNIETENE